MGTFTKQHKRAMHRRGKQLLKSKIGLYKRHKISLKSLSSKSKIFAPTIVLPASLQPTNFLKPNSIRIAHTSSQMKSPLSPLSASSSSPFRNGFSGTTVPSDDRSTSTRSSFASATKKTLKKMSLKKLLGVKKNKQPTTMEDQVIAFGVENSEVDNDTAKKPVKTVLVLEGSGSDDTEDITNPNTPVRNEKDNSSKNLAATPSNGSSISGASSNDGKSSNGPYIFADTDDDEDQDHDTNDDKKLHNSSDERKAGYSDENIQARLEIELNKLEEKLRAQKAERRALAKEHFESTLLDEEEKEIDIHDSESSGEEKQNVTIHALYKNASPITPKNFTNTEKKRNRFFSLALLLFPIVLSMHWFRSRASVAPYSHDIAIEQAQAFFGTSTTMEGITVVLSETTSRLGSTIGDRFTQLGATVESFQDEINCSDLVTVAKSVDSMLKKHQTVDFLVHTGNLCLNHNQDTIRYLTSNEPTVQGYDNLVGGNYLSAFLMTQKILSSLEQSKYGTLVQFTSKTSALAYESYPKPELSSTLSLPSIPFPGDSESRNLFSQLFHLPLRFASVKLAEIVQHRVLARAYPNIRTIEISSGWIGIGEKAADDFFRGVFRKQEESSPRSSSSSDAIGSSTDDEELQENLYEWSLNAVWKWAAPPTLPPITEMILGSPPSRQVMARSEQESPSASVARYFPASAATVFTSSALALLAMKAKTVAWASGNPSD